MTILKIVVCSKCEQLGKPVETYRIGVPGRLTKIPLCEDCASPLQALMALVAPRRRAVNKPTTMDRVAAAKKASPRKAKPVVKRTR